MSLWAQDKYQKSGWQNDERWIFLNSLPLPFSALLLSTRLLSPGQPAKNAACKDLSYETILYNLYFIRSFLMSDTSL